MKIDMEAIMKKNLQVIICLLTFTSCNHHNIQSLSSISSSNMSSKYEESSETSFISSESSSILSSEDSSFFVEQPVIIYSNEDHSEESIDDSKQYEYYDSYINVSGSFSSVDDGILSKKYTSTASNSMMINDDVPFNYGTISCRIKSNNTTDTGIVFNLTANGKNVFWENNVSYYFFFLSQGGNAYLGKVDYGKWTALSVTKIAPVDSNKEYELKVILKGSKIIGLIDDEVYVGIRDSNRLNGTAYGFRTGSSNVIFSDIEVTSRYVY